MDGRQEMDRVGLVRPALTPPVAGPGRRVRTTAMEATQPDARPDVLGASRGRGDADRDADAAAGGRRAEASTEYAANAETDPAAADGDGGTAADLDPHEPPGQG